MSTRFSLALFALIAALWSVPGYAAAPVGKTNANAASPALDDMVTHAVESFKSGQVSYAIQTLQRCIAMNKNFPGCQRTLGIVYGKTGDLHKATTYLKAYLKLLPKAQDATQVRELMTAYEAASDG